MNRTVAFFLVAGMAAASAQAFADDMASTNPNPDAKKWMHACMDKMKQANNGMSENDMKKSCHDQMKQNVDHPDSMAAPVVPGH